MKKALFVSIITIFSLLFFVLFSQPSFAQEKTQQTPQQEFSKAVVLKTLKQGTTKDFTGRKNYSQTVQVRILEGNEKNKIVSVEYTGQFLTSSQKLQDGEEVVLLRTTPPHGKPIYSIMDRYRLNNLIYILIAFFALVVLVAGKKGLGSILGLIISLSVIMFFIVPQILGGRDPLFISIVGALLIMLGSMYIAHGFSRKTSIAVAATFISLLLAGFLGVYFVDVMNLTGMGSEDAYMLQMGAHAINLKGILLGGIIIGALGVLDDVTTTQTTTIAEIARTGKKLSFEELAAKGFAIGKDHIASVVNTLVLAYAGASLSLFILFVLNPSREPYWVILNSQLIMEEVVRTLAGSIGLILAVPITTILAAFIYYSKKPNRE